MNWKVAFALFAPLTGMGALAGGCANDVCTQADNQLAACAPAEITLPSANSNNNAAQECTARRACQSDCINKASCTELNEALCVNQSACRPLQGAPSPFTTCMKACEGL